MAGGEPHQGLNGSDAGHWRAPVDQATATSAFADGHACPLLGFVDNPTSHYSRPTFLHRCYAMGRGDPVSRDTQSELCLTARHARCERFLEAHTHSAVHRPEPAPVQYAAPRARSAPASPASEPVADVGRSLASASAGALEVADAVDRPPADSPVEVPPTKRERSGAFWGVRGLLAASVGVLAVIIIATQLRPATPPPVRVDLPQPTLVPTALPTAFPTPLPIAAATVPVPATVAPTTTNAAPSATGVPTLTLFAPALLEAQFATRQADWPENPPYATWSAGAYRLSARDQGHFVALAAPATDLPADVDVRARFQKTGGPAGGGYGIILRDQSRPALDGVQQGGSYYVLELSDRGEVGAWRRDQDQWIELMPWTRTGVDTPANAINDLEARATGDVLTLSVAGSRILQVQDRTLASGGVGVFVGGDGNQVALLALSVTKAD